jgi:integrase
VLVLLGGIMGRAKRKGWITANPCADAESVTVRRSEELNVLDVEQVHAVARAAPSDQLAALLLVAAFTGLRQGELLALRRRHVDFADRILHVRRNRPAGTGAEEAPKSHRIRTVPLSDQALVALDGLSRREHFTAPERPRVRHRRRRAPQRRQRARRVLHGARGGRARAPTREGRPDRLP